MSLSIDINLARLPRGHAAFQAGEQGSKSDTAFRVKGINLNRPGEDTGRLTGHRYIHETTLQCISGSSCSVATRPAAGRSARRGRRC